MLIENQNADKANLDQRLQEKYDKRSQMGHTKPCGKIYGEA